MSKLTDTLHDFVARFSEHEPIALVGGLAVSARTEPRFTRDIDFVIAVDNDAAAEAAVLRAQGMGYLVETALVRARSRELATVRLRRAPKDPIVDLLFAACGIEREIVDAATMIVVRGQAIRVATVGHLIAMKLVSQDAKRRPRDQEDLLALGRVADEIEWSRAERAVQLIHERGFARQRDLVAALSELRDTLSEE